MPILSRVVGSGTPAGAATNILGDTVLGLTATGNSQGTALPIGSANNVFGTVAASTGAILPAGLAPGDVILIVNYGASPLTVYPPSGGKLNAGTTNAGVALANGKVAEYICVTADGLGFAINASA